MYGELSNYLRWQRRFVKRTAEEEGTMQPARVSESVALPDPVQAPPWRPLKNPDATFLGLSTEVRVLMTVDPQRVLCPYSRVV